VIILMNTAIKNIIHAPIATSSVIFATFFITFIILVNY